MEPSQPDAANDDSMDSFLEKFQSHPYRGGFHEDQWEEVSGLGGSARVCVCRPDTWDSRVPPVRAGLWLPADGWLLVGC
jgi:hypothetical protein